MTWARLSLLILLVGATGCTDPARVGPPPQFVELTDPGSALGLARLQAADSCPTLPAADTTGQRVTLADAAATIALPAGMQGPTAGFGSRPGVIFSDQTRGMLAIAYDSDVPVRWTRLILGVSGGLFTGTLTPEQFAYACRVRFNGTLGTLFLNRVPGDIIVDGVTRGAYQYGNSMVFVARTAAGKRINVMALTFAGASPVFDDGTAVMSLIAAGTTLRW